MATTQKMNETGLKHGQFKVNMRFGEKEVRNCVIDSLTQDDYADNWRLVLPKVHYDSTIHHFSVYLSQLPPHLWNRLSKSYDFKGNMYYDTINDRIYQYTVKPSNHDEKILDLYREITKNHPDKRKIMPIYRYLEEQRVKGWIMIRARCLI